MKHPTEDADTVSAYYGQPQRAEIPIIIPPLAGALADTRPHNIVIEPKGGIWNGAQPHASVVVNVNLCFHKDINKVGEMMNSGADCGAEKTENANSREVPSTSNESKEQVITASGLKEASKVKGDRTSRLSAVVLQNKPSLLRRFFKSYNDAFGFAGYATPALWGSFVIWAAWEESRKKQDLASKL